MHPNPLLGRRPDYGLQPRGEQSRKRQDVSLLVSAAVVAHALDGDLMVFGAAVMPAKYYGCAGAKRQRSRGRRSKSRPSEKGHVIAGRLGILVDQKGHQTITAQSTEDRFATVAVAPEYF